MSPGERREEVRCIRVRSVDDVLRCDLSSGSVHFPTVIRGLRYGSDWSGREEVKLKIIRFPCDIVQLRY